ncbi:MAG: histidine--tRNA ligase [Puniceicoccales bacterium]|jgi:histidyl-tRNA synthetase|nr:histidine--tRNA ligase [Puniceicoccales bacterium]
MIQNLPGFRDFYPEECALRHTLFETMRNCAQHFGFEEYDAPILEPLELFTEKSGDEIVDQLFSFTDKGGRAVALRPEMTPSLVRMVGAKIHSLPKPIKWFSIAEQFRYERPQKGRLRSFYQFNADILSEISIAADAEVIALGIHILTTLGLTAEDFHVRLSDRKLWALFLETQGIPTSLLQPTLAIIDKFDRERPEQFLSPLRSLSADISWESVLENIEHFRSLKRIDALWEFSSSQRPLAGSVSALEQRLQDMACLLSRLHHMGYGDVVTLDLRIVRGLAYYTGFVFEFFERQGDMRAIAGGGRYDNLFQKFGYPDTPAVGLAIGDVTLQMLLEKKALRPQISSCVDIILCFDSPATECLAIKDASQLRQRGYAVTYSISPIRPISKQLKLIKPQETTWIVLYDGEKVLIRRLEPREEHRLHAEEVLNFFPPIFKSPEWKTTKS